MALLEDALGGWTGGALLGIGAAVVAPSIVPAAGSILRPVAKVLVRGGLLVTESVRGVFAEASEHVTDLVAEVRAESDARSSRGRVDAHAATRTKGRHRQSRRTILLLCGIRTCTSDRSRP